MNLSFAYSPCPNDSFAFYALEKGLVSSPNFQITTKRFALHQLNQMQVDLMKVSAVQSFALAESYQILQTGASFGMGYGPLVVSKNPALSKPNSVAIAGQHTTSHLLWELWNPNSAIHQVFMPFHQILSAVSSQQVDAGVIVHESRFCLERDGLVACQDLGKFWHEQFQLPLPLGVLVAKKSLGQKTIQEVEELIQKSILYAQSHRLDLAQHAMLHAQEKDIHAVLQHIDLYVNDMSLKFSEKGHQALQLLKKQLLKKQCFEKTSS